MHFLFTKNIASDELEVSVHVITNHKIDNLKKSSIKDYFNKK